MSSSNGVDGYFRAVKELETRVVEGQRNTLIEIAQRMAETTPRNRRILPFGTGHSFSLTGRGRLLSCWRTGKRRTDVSRALNAPSSTVICALLWNSLVAESARLLIGSQITSPRFVSLNVAGAAERNQTLLQKWRPRNMHL